jgi:hypothetical protein
MKLKKKTPSKSGRRTTAKGRGKASKPPQKEDRQMPLLTAGRYQVEIDNYGHELTSGGHELFFMEFTVHGRYEANGELGDFLGHKGLYNQILPGGEEELRQDLESFAPEVTVLDQLGLDHPEHVCLLARQVDMIFEEANVRGSTCGVWKVARDGA